MLVIMRILTMKVGFDQYISGSVDRDDCDGV